MLRSMAALTIVAAAPASPQVQVTAAMASSAAGWNAGDLDRFMAVYAGDAIYVTKAGLVQGRAAIADHYRPSFVAGGNSRGMLSFDTLGYRTLSAVHVILFARWRLMPAGGVEQTGMTTLVFERRKEGWRIISDHSS